MESQRSFRGFRSRNGSKLPNLSPKQTTKAYKYGKTGPKRRRGEPGVLIKKDRANDFKFHSKHQEIDILGS